MYGHFDDFGPRGGMGRGGGFGRGGGWGFRRGNGYGCGRGMGRGFGYFGLGLQGEHDIDTLKLYRDSLDLRKKDIEAGLKHVNEKIASIEK